MRNQSRTDETRLWIFYFSHFTEIIRRFQKCTASSRTSLHALFISKHPFDRNASIDKNSEKRSNKSHRYWECFAVIMKLSWPTDQLLRNNRITNNKKLSAKTTSLTWTKIQQKLLDELSPTEEPRLEDTKMRHHTIRGLRVVQISAQQTKNIVAIM